MKYYVTKMAVLAGALLCGSPDTDPAFDSVTHPAALDLVMAVPERAEALLLLAPALPLAMRRWLRRRSHA